MLCRSKISKISAFAPFSSSIKGPRQSALMGNLAHAASGWFSGSTTSSLSFFEQDGFKIRPRGQPQKAAVNPPLRDPALNFGVIAQQQLVIDVGQPVRGNA